MPLRPSKKKGEPSLPVALSTGYRFGAQVFPVPPRWVKEDGSGDGGVGGMAKAQPPRGTPGCLQRPLHLPSPGPSPGAVRAEVWPGTRAGSHMPSLGSGGLPELQSSPGKEGRDDSASVARSGLWDGLVRVNSVPS